MFPILNAAQIKLADAYTIEHDRISSLDLMERASRLLFDKMKELFPELKHCVILCGNGNNGGDGWVLARLLHENSIEVIAVEIDPEGTKTEENRVNRQKADSLGIKILSWDQISETNIQVGKNTLIIDAVFGCGLSRELSGIHADCIRYFNNLKGIKLAVDVPSGLATEGEINQETVIFKADYTLTMQLPKLNFLNPDVAYYVGEIHVVDIGLNEDFIRKQEGTNFWITDQDIKSFFPMRKSNQSKHDFGHALIVAGSQATMGAAILATRACLRSGAGLTTVHVPSFCSTAMNIAAPEAMLSIDSNPNRVSEIPDLQYKTAIGIGPGIGKHKETGKVLKELLKNKEIPKVIDADALNLLAEDQDLYRCLNSNTILTPHQREFDRLTKSHSNWTERIQTAKEFTQQHSCILVLKAPHTMIFSPDGKVFYNSTGNVGLAKGGSGDILTGIITSYLAQGIEPLQAALAGVYHHGLSADLAAKEINKRSLLAGGIITYLSKLPY